MLIYIGRGAFLYGVPARDLTDKEVKKHGKDKLLESGLYEKPKKIPLESVKRGRSNGRN